MYRTRIDLAWTRRYGAQHDMLATPETLAGIQTELPADVRLSAYAHRGDRLCWIYVESVSRESLRQLTRSGPFEVDGFRYPVLQRPRVVQLGRMPRRRNARPAPFGSSFWTSLLRDLINQ
jgi:hypothetical protein